MRQPLRLMCLAVIDTPEAVLARLDAKISGPEIAGYVEQMIVGLLDQTDLPREAQKVGIRLIAGAAARAAMIEDRLLGLHELDQACQAVARLGAWRG